MIVFAQDHDPLAQAVKVHDRLGRVVKSHETPARIFAIADGLGGIDTVCLPPKGLDNDLEIALSDAHDQEMLSYIGSLSRNAAESGPVQAERFRTPTSLQPTTIEADTWDLALSAAGLCVAAIDGLATGTLNTAYVLVRPPGHHAGRTFFGAYCFINNAAVAAFHARRKYGHRVAVLDLDYHAGNGTLDCIADTPDISFASIHRSTVEAFPFCPELAPRNSSQWMYGVAGQIDEANYLALLDAALANILDQRTEILIVSVGFDLVDGDPHGGWQLTPRIFNDIGRRLAAIDRPILFLQEGGYLLNALPHCAANLKKGYQQGEASK